jgi:uncharacterized RDD family membrane protein YckC
MHDPSPDQPRRAEGGRFLRNSPLADRSSRLLAALVDAVLVMLSILPGGILTLLALRDRRSSWFTDPLLMAGCVLLVLGGLGLEVYQWLLLTRQGQTIGKRLQGIRIVRYEGEANPGFLNVVVLRRWLPILIAWIPYIGGFFILIDVLCIFGNERRCLHDMIAQTRVVVVSDLERDHGEDR